jgi:hypothetical protein
MIFVATGANAVANNIGKISIKTVDDIMQSTKDLLTFFDKSWNDTQKVAIDDFFVGFNAAAWKSKIKILTMPILMKAENAIVGSRFTAAGSPFRKNLANFNVELTTVAGLLLADYGMLGVSQNGIVFQGSTSGSAPGTVHANCAARYSTTAFGITNKAAHHGVYAIGATKFRAGQASTAQSLIILNAANSSGEFYQSLKSIVPLQTPHKGFYSINGSVPLAAGKSRIKNNLVSTQIVGTTASTVQTEAGIIEGGNDNVINESTCSLVTFGDYLTDAEELEYFNLINPLMNMLVV